MYPADVFLQALLLMLNLNSNLLFPAQISIMDIAVVLLWTLPIQTWTMVASVVFRLMLIYQTQTLTESTMAVVA